MFIISDNNEHAVALSHISAFRIYDKDDDADFDLYANIEAAVVKDDSIVHCGYRLFSSADKQECVTIRDILIARIKDRSLSAAIRVSDLVAELKRENGTHQDESE